MIRSRKRPESAGLEFGGGLRRDELRVKGFSGQAHGQYGSQPWGGALWPLRVCPRRRAAGRTGDARQDAARHPARPPDQGRLYRGDRGRQARGLPQPQLHLRLRALLRALSRDGSGRGVPPLLPGERLRRPERRQRRRPGAAEAGRRRGGAADGGRLPPGFRDRAAGGRRHAGDPAIGDRLGAGAGGALDRPRLRRLDRAAEHPAGAVRAGRGAAGGGRRARPAGGARDPGLRRAGADRAREPGGGDGARRSLPRAGARGADPGAARRADRRDRSGPDRAPRPRDAGGGADAGGGRGSGRAGRGRGEA